MIKVIRNFVFAYINALSRRLKLEWSAISKKTNNNLKICIYGAICLIDNSISEKHQKTNRVISDRTMPIIHSVCGVNIVKIFNNNSI